LCWWPGFAVFRQPLAARHRSGSNATVFVSCFIDAAGSGHLSERWVFAVVGLLLVGFAGSKVQGQSNSELKIIKSDSQFFNFLLQICNSNPFQFALFNTYPITCLLPIYLFY
jgi:hypothetical protein